MEKQRDRVDELISRIFSIYLAAHNGYGEWGHIIAVRDLANTTLLDLIDSNDCLNGDEASLHTIEFCLQLLFRRVHDNLRTLIENIVFDLDKSIQVALIDLFYEYFVDLPLVEEGYLVYFRGISHDYQSLILSLIL